MAEHHHKQLFQKKQLGFTIVELLIVIVVIGILAAIVIVAYQGVTAKASYSHEQADMRNLNHLIQLYYVDNGQYPSTGGTGNWQGWNQAGNFIPGIVSKYASNMPQMPTNPATENSYLYTSNGTDYKLIRFSPPSGLPSVERTNSNLSDPVRPVNANNGAWGYWSSGGASW